MMKSFWRQPLTNEWAYATREDQTRLAHYLELQLPVESQDWEIEVAKDVSGDTVIRAFEHFQEPGIRASLGWLLISVAEDLFQDGEIDRARDLIERLSEIARKEPSIHAYAVWYWSGGQFPVDRFGISGVLMPLRECIQNELARDRSSD